jgi:DNA-binding response OmpR family regulator
MTGRTRVLIIEDDLPYAEILRVRLEEDGFEVRETYDAASGLRAAYDWHPAAILLDVMMPGIDGFEACQRLREITNAVIVITSVHGRNEDIIRGLDAGADDYIVKPFDFPVLRARLLACLLDRRRPIPVVGRRRRC